jgi:hypothetical protein
MDNYKEQEMASKWLFKKYKLPIWTVGGSSGSLSSISYNAGGDERAPEMM